MDGIQCHVTEGVLVSCDPAARERIMMLDKTEGQSFILRVLNENQLLIKPAAIPMIQADIEEMYSKASFEPDMK